MAEKAKQVIPSDYWVCACVKRNEDGTLKAIRKNHPSVEQCPACKCLREDDEMADDAMASDAIDEALRDAAARLRASHPTRPYVTVVATLAMGSSSDAEDCRPVYAARADGGGFVPWSGTGATLAEAVAGCVADMEADPDTRLRAEAATRGYDLVKRKAVVS